MRMCAPAFAVLHHAEGDPPDRPTARVYAELLEHVVVAEQQGFDIVWFAEHHGDLDAGRLPAPVPFIIKAAEHTKRVTLGTAVTLLPFHHPLAVAEQAAEADILTGGRFALGIGSGSAPADFAAFGVDPASKGTRMREGLEVLLRAWSGERFTFHGQHYQVENARIAPVATHPARDLLWLAVGHPETAKTAGLLDMHLLLARGTPVERAQQLIAEYDAALHAAGHSGADRFIQRTWIVYVDETDGEARRLAEPGIRYFYQFAVAHGRPRVPNDDRLDVLLATVDAIVGTPEHVATQLAQRSAQLGLTHIALSTRIPEIPHEKTLRSTELLGQQVLPWVKAHYKHEG